MNQTKSQNTQNKILQIFNDFQTQALLAANRDIIKNHQKSSLPIVEYLICITPRSGSSWLTEILSGTKILGNPEEWFNPGNLPGIIQNRYPCLDIIEYFDCIKRTQCTENKVFGMELSFFQHQLLCDALETTKKDSSLSLLNPEKNKFIYLYRLDLVAQAVSLYRAVETGMFHSAQTNASEKALVDFKYSDDRIWHWLIHILQQEFGWQQNFSKKCISPLYLTYEEMWSNPNLTKLRLINHILGNLDQINQIDESSSYNHAKIANSKSNEIITKFYQDYAKEIDFCLQNRGKLNAIQIRKELEL
ncbi:MAG: Stf0 family sulfotransferase [Microcoleaceae cyanobacterium MO_207.B10]|nr:Stf0 family sulfotransferase [Microcoleaceae cyanobacterium MO_207.B10]